MKFVLRNANINDIEGLAVASTNCLNEIFCNVLSDEALESFTLQKAVKKWRNEFVDQTGDADKAILLIENESGNIVGYSVCGLAKAMSKNVLGDGEIFSLYVEPDHQGYGLGKALMLANARWLISRGLFSGGIWLPEANELGRRFCEDLGAREEGARTKNVMGQSIPMTGFTWDDLANVAQLENAVPDWGGFGR